MCIPHGIPNPNSSFTLKEKKVKHIEKVSKKIFEKGDPNFVDERTKTYKPKKKEGFFSWLFK